MEKLFKTTDGLPVLALTLPNHLEIIIQDYRKKLFQAGAGVYCRFFVPFFFLGWGKPKRWNTSLTGSYLPLGPFRIEGLICSPEGLLFLKTELNPSAFPPAQISAPIKLQQGFFLGNYEQGTELALNKLPVPQGLCFSTLILKCLKIDFTPNSALVSQISSRPLNGLSRE